MTLYTFACELTDYWTANDGGLTMAAADVRHVGAWADRLLAGVESGEISPFEAMDSLNPFSADTGAESDVLCAAQEYLASPEFDNIRRWWRDVEAIEEVARQQRQPLPHEEWDELTPHRARWAA